MPAQSIAVGDARPKQEPRRKARIAVAGEYIAGHVTFLDTLDAVARGRDDLELSMIRLAFPPEAAWEHLPFVHGNWSARASLRARGALDAIADDHDAVLIHTQTAALASVGLMRRMPVVLSCDATPIDYDTVGGAHGHHRGPEAVEAVKQRIIRRTYHNAAAIVAWSDWVRRSLIGDYGVPARRISLISAGVKLAPPAPDERHGGPVRLLYVARNFAAKGGEDLLAALAELHGWELDVVTTSDCPSPPGVRVHRGLTPSSPLLAALYRDADLVVLPTHSDSSPFALVEGMAAGAAVITTPVGAIPEMVTPDVGILVEPGDVAGLRAAIARLLDDEPLRRAMGAAARARAEERYDASRQANRMLDLLVALAAQSAERARAGA